MIASRDTFVALIKELACFEIFEGFKADAIENFVRESRVVYTGHRENLYRQGDEAESFGIVLNGAYKLVKTSKDGAETIIHFSLAGDIIGALLMNKNPTLFPVSAVAMGPSRFLKIPKQRFLDEWSSHPELLVRIQGLLLNRVNHFRDQKSMQRAPLASRIAALLVSLADGGEETRSQELEQAIPVPLTRKEIAECLGASVEAVIRVMSEWSKQKIIATADQHITILDPVALAKESQRL